MALRLSGQRGQALTELAISLPLILLSLLGVLHFGALTQLKQATHIASRYLAYRVVDPLDSTVPMETWENSFHAAYPLAGSAQWSRGVGESWGSSGALVLETTMGALWMGALAEGVGGSVNLALYPWAMATTLPAEPEIVSAQVTATYASPWLPWVEPARVSAQQRLPATTGIREDWDGQEVILATELGFAAYSYERN